MTNTSDPQRIGRYSIVERIGRGAMGDVYRAHDARIGRTVAIKVLHVHDPELRERFRQEVQSAGTLKHPNIVTIYDYDEDDGRGQPFIVMEDVEGRTLADLLRDRHPLSLPEKLRLLEQLCSALDYAHDHGVVHRDVKPANLMVDADGTLKVLDFGIARIGDGQLTRVGAVLGTFTYMSPEQIDGGVIDRRADIFSVGVVAYELLSSQQPFQGETVSRVMHAILHERPRALTELCADLDPELGRIVETAIQKNPAQRYATLRHLAADLERVASRVGVADVESTVVIDRGGRAPSRAVASVARRDTAERRGGSIGVRRASLIAGVALVAGIAVSAFFLTPRTSERPANATEAELLSTLPVSDPAVPPDAKPETLTNSPPKDEAGEGRAVRRDLRERRDQPIVQPVETPQRTPYEEAHAILDGATDSSGRLKAADLLQEACDQHEVRGCRELAQMFQRGAGVARDDVRAAALYERGCGDGDGASCNQAGLLRRDGAGSVRNLSESVRWFERGCEGGANEGCNNLGLAYARGVAVARDDVRAAALFQRACDGGLPVACTNLGRAYQQGRGVSRDDSEARSLLLKACDAGGMLACVDAGVMFARGRGGAPDEARGVMLFQQACDAGIASGCGNLAGAYVRGRVVPRDDTRAASLFERACNGGGAPGCAGLAGMYAEGRGVPRDEGRALSFLHRACDGGVADSCRTLAERYEQGRGVERNPARAGQLLQRAKQLSGSNGAGDTGGPVGGVAGGAAVEAPPPLPPPVAPIRISGTMKPPVKTKDVRPVYPSIAQSAGVQGVVVVEMVIGAEGKITEARVLRSIPLLDQAALDAVKQWEFTPTIVNGAAVPVLATATVNFSLASASPRGRSRGRQ